MKKSLIASIIFAGIAASAHATPSGTASFNASFADYNNYPDAQVQALSTLMDVGSQTKLGLSLTNVRAFDDHARVLGVRLVHDFGNGYLVDGSVAKSDRAKITINERFNVAVRKKVGEAQNTIIGLGVDTFDMREGGRSVSLRPSVVHYVQSMPLVLQADAAFSQSSVNDRKGHMLNLAATYGRVGEWTVFGSISSGRAHYELLKHPGSVADYNTRTLTVGGHYWMDKDWGFNAAVSNTDNRYFKRNEIRMGVFWKF